MTEWVFGACLNISGSVLINLGTNVMKLGQLRFQKRRRRVALQDALFPPLILEHHHIPENVTVFRCCQDVWTWIPSKNHCHCRRALLSKTWIFGFVAFLGGNILNFLSFGYAAQSLLASLGSVQFVTNVIFARVVLKETIRQRTLLGTLVLITGVGLVVSFSCHDNPATDYSLNKLVSLFYETHYVIYLLILLLIFLWSQWVLSRRKNNNKAGSSNEGKENTDAWEAIAYAAVSAIIGAQAVTFFKILSELMTISANVQPDDRVTKTAIFHSPFTYFVLFMAVFTSLFWMHRLNEALRMYNVLLIIPLFQVMWVSLSVVGGGIFFKEFQGSCFKGETAFMFILGLLVIFGGVYLLSPQEEDAGEQKRNDVSGSIAPLLSDEEQQQHAATNFVEQEVENSEDSFEEDDSAEQSINMGWGTAIPVFGVLERLGRRSQSSLSAAPPQGSPTTDNNNSE